VRPAQRQTGPSVMRSCTHLVTRTLCANTACTGWQLACVVYQHLSPVSTRKPCNIARPGLTIVIWPCAFCMHQLYAVLRVRVRLPFLPAATSTCRASLWCTP
jgi:hypothetical protein